MPRHKYLDGTTVPHLEPQRSNNISQLTINISSNGMQHWRAIKGPTKNAPHPQKCVHVHKAHNQETCLFIVLAKSNFKVPIIS